MVYVASDDFKSDQCSNAPLVRSDLISTLSKEPPTCRQSATSNLISSRSKKPTTRIQVGDFKSDQLFIQGPFNKSHVLRPMA